MTSISSTLEDREDVTFTSCYCRKIHTEEKQTAIPIDLDSVQPGDQWS